MPLGGIIMTCGSNKKNLHNLLKQGHRCFHYYSKRKAKILKNIAILKDNDWFKIAKLDTVAIGKPLLNLVSKSLRKKILKRPKSLHST